MTNGLPDFTLFFPCTLLLIHGFICPANYIIHRSVCLRIIFRDPHCHIHLIPLVCCRVANLLCILFKQFCQLFSVLIILTLQNNSEFIAPDSEYRAAFENAADQSACGLDEHIAFIMSILIVDLFQIITIQDNDGKLKLFFVINPILKVPGIFVETALIPYRGERIDKNAPVQIVHLVVAFFHFSFCPDDTNLALTPVADPVCELTDLLRNKTPGNYDALYTQIMKETDKLTELLK